MNVRMPRVMSSVLLVLGGALPTVAGATPFPSGDLTLTHTDLLPGVQARIDVTGAAAGETVYVAAGTQGLGAGSCYRQAGGLCLDLAGAPRLVGTAPTDATGSAFLSFRMPAVAPGTRVAFQAVVVRGLGGANSIKSFPAVGTVGDGSAPCNGEAATSGGRQYLFCAEPASWDEAWDTCVGLDADLTTLGSAAEDTSVTALAMGVSSEDWWIGYTDQVTESFFQWVDGSPTLYLDWAPGEPNDFNGNEDCAEIAPSGRWNDDDCAGAEPFVCEAPAPAAGGCTGPSAMVDGVTYLVCPRLVAWASARDSCAQLGFELAVVRDLEESEWIASQAGGDAWIGLDDDATEGTFEWGDGSPTYFTNWRTGEPNNYNGSEDCALVTPDGAWNDMSCSNLARFVCKR